LDVAGKALQVLEMAARMVEIGNLNAITDASAAANLAYAAIKGAALNVQVNLLGMENENEPASLLERITVIRRSADDLISIVKEYLKQRSQLTM